jgi:glycosyltransferase involved in cell wall biosynthesis
VLASGGVASNAKKTPPRIVHLVTDLRLGGTQRMILARVRGIPGYEHHVWAPARVTSGRASDIVEELEDLGAKLMFGRAGAFGAATWFARARMRITRVLPAIVESTLYHTHLVAPHLASAAGARLVLTKESTDDWMSPAQARREAGIALRADAVVAVSQAAVEALARSGASEARVRVIPNGIPPGPPSWRPLEEDDDAPLILFVGRLDPAKGLPDLLDAVGLLRERGTAVRLQIQGDGREETRVREAIARPPLSGCARLVHRDEADRCAPRCRRSPCVFVLPSRYEGFGVVLLEAMRLGLPIVATRAGGIPEVVRDGVDGLLVPPGDPRALAEAIARVLSEPDLRDRLVASGVDRADGFTEEAMCAAWGALYAELSAGP